MMPIGTINEDVKSVLERIGSMCSRVESVLNLCMLGFVKNKIEFVDEADTISQSVHKEENELINILSAMATGPEADTALIKSLMAVVGHIELATDMLDIVLKHVRAKASEKILFSDKGKNEVRLIFKETLDVLKTAEDVILTKNEVLRKHISEKYESISRTASMFSEEHEDRLVKGLCSPKSSSLYLSIVDSQLKVVLHIKQAVDRLFCE
ncbi:MAG: hypothetical protein MRJ65_02705 [Candidatus Brocadiaceae bacterium]|nr:hypothetical protein [Candidatus Brocadiaceae bacterium]